MIIRAVIKLVPELPQNSKGVAQRSRFRKRKLDAKESFRIRFLILLREMLHSVDRTLRFRVCELAILEPYLKSAKQSILGMKIL